MRNNNTNWKERRKNNWMKISDCILNPNYLLIVDCFFLCTSCYYFFLILWRCALCSGMFFFILSLSFIRSSSRACAFLAKLWAAAFAFGKVVYLTQVLHLHKNYYIAMLFSFLCTTSTLLTPCTAHTHKRIHYKTKNKSKFNPDAFDEIQKQHTHIHDRRTSTNLLDIWEIVTFRCLRSHLK